MDVLGEYLDWEVEHVSSEGVRNDRADGEKALVHKGKDDEIQSLRGNHLGVFVLVRLQDIEAALDTDYHIVQVD